MRLRKAAIAAVGAALVAVGAIAVGPAMAAESTYGSWVEKDDQAPFETTGGLVFYKDANINFGDGVEGDLEPLVPLAELDGLSYSVAESTSYSPSYQIGVVNDTVTYARLVWEANQQTPSPGDNVGDYVNLEDGLWWGANVWEGSTKTTPFAGGPGSQSDPQPLEFFQDHFGAGAKVTFFGLAQGSSTDSVSTVTSLGFEGERVPLGAADKTPFDHEDVAAKVAAATAPLDAKIADLKAELAAYRASHPLTPAEARAGYVNSAAAASAKWALVNKGSLVAAQNSTTINRAKIVSITGTVKVGKTVTAKTESITGATHSYQWYLDGTAIKGATKAKLKLARSHGGDSLSVKITTSWTDQLGAKHSVTATAKHLRTAYVAR